MEENIPAHVIPIQSEDLHYQIARIYGDLEEKEAMRSILETLVNHPNGRPLNRVEYANTFFKEPDDTEKSLQILESMRSDYLRKESMLKTRGFSKKEFVQVADLITKVISGLKENPSDNSKAEKEVQKEIVDLCSDFPIYSD